MLLFRLVYSVLSVLLISPDLRKVMAEGGIVGESDANDTMSSYAEVAQLVPGDVLLMTVDELRTHLRIRDISHAGAAKPELQLMLLQAIGMRVPSMDDITELETRGVEQPPVSQALTVPSGATASVPPGVEMAAPDYSLPPRARTPEQAKAVESTPSGNTKVLELKFELELWRLELEAKETEKRREAEEKDRQRQFEAQQQQFEAQEREKQRQFELCKLELQRAPQVPIPARREGPPPFLVENAVRLIPKFQDMDIETFLLSFEKIAVLNNFPQDKYTAILQAHLTGKALKVFTELTTDECQNYQTLKQAFLAAYAVVPEVYRKRFRASTKGHLETFSEFAFRLTTQFKRWAESEKAFEDVAKMRELIMMEQFNSHLDPGMHGWLIDQKPTTLVELARLADQYMAIYQADYFKKPPQNPKSGQLSLKQEKHFPQKVQEWQQAAGSKQAEKVGKPNSPNNAKPQASVFGGSTHCYYCKKPGHLTANCQKRLKKLSASSVEEKPIQLVIALPVASQDSSLLTRPCPEVDPLYEKHCVDALLVSTEEQSKRPIKVLRDTGALQSLVSVLLDDEMSYTGEKRLIRGVTGDVIAVPLVAVTLHSSLCSGTFLCDLISTLPDGIAMLVGNDLCCDDMIADVDMVITGSMAAAQRDQDNQSITQNSVSEPTEQNNSDFSQPNPSDSAEILPDITSLFEQNVVENINRSRLIELQQTDSSLQSLFALCDDANSDYMLQSGVLVRIYRDSVSPPAAAVHQIVAAVVLRPRLLQIAHEIPAAAHLGVAKTSARLQRHFYWPGITTNVKEFCRTCDVCQKLGKGGPAAVAPLHALPLVTEPFCQVAIDIIGPLPPCKDSGNRFILTVLDLCTHFPEAIPLRQHTAQDVAKALATVFSRYSFV